MPESGKIYSFNEGNYGGWAAHLQAYMDSLKDASKWGGKPYSARRAQKRPNLAPAVSACPAGRPLHVRWRLARS